MLTLMIAMALLLCLGVGAVAEMSDVIPPPGTELPPEGELPPEEPPLPLQGIIIGIDAGHQDKANLKLEPIMPGSREKKMKCSYGTRGRYTRVPEYVLTLKIAKQLRDELVLRGATVFMTREKSNVNIPNSKRAKDFNKQNVDLAIHLHCDGGPSSLHGATMYIPSASCVPKSVRKQSEAAGKAIIKAMVKATGAKNRGVRKTGGFTTLNYAKVPALLFEMGFLSNRAEEKKLTTAKYQKKIVMGIANGMEKYFKSIQ